MVTIRLARGGAKSVHFTTSLLLTAVTLVTVVSLSVLVSSTHWLVAKKKLYV